MQINQSNYEQLDWEKVDGLMPAIIQDASSGRVLMQGYMNREALHKTLDTHKVTFFSRTKQKLWCKGETSGNFLILVDANADCDRDSLLILAQPKGPTCHLGTESCWAEHSLPDYTFLAQLEGILASRKNASPDSSYTASLYSKGIKRIAQKVGEEGVETALAATVQDIDELKNESADLLYHLLVLLQASNISMTDVIQVLKKRNSKS